MAHRANSGRRISLGPPPDGERGGEQRGRAGVEWHRRSDAPDERPQAGAEELDRIAADRGEAAAIQEHPDGAAHGDHDRTNGDIEPDVEELLAAPARTAHAGERTGP